MNKFEQTIAKRAVRGFFCNLIFAIIARMLCGNHLKSCFSLALMKVTLVRIKIISASTTALLIRDTAYINSIDLKKKYVKSFPAGIITKVAASFCKELGSTNISFQKFTGV